MAFAFVGLLGFNTATASGSTLVITTSATASVGDLVVVRIATDNNDGSTPTFTCADSAGNTWVTDIQAVKGSSAGDGVAQATMSSYITNQLNSGGTITITLSNAVPNRSATAYNFTGGAGRRGATAATGTSAFPSVTDTSPISGDLVIGSVGAEIVQSPDVFETDSTNGTWQNNSFLDAGGPGTSGVQIDSNYKITSGGSGSQTYNITLRSSTSTDWVATIAVYSPPGPTDVSAPVVALAVVVDAPTVTASGTVTPSSVDLAAVVPAPTAGTSQTAAADVVALAVVVPSPSITLTAIQAHPSVVALAAVVPSPNMGQVVHPSTVARTVVIPTPSLLYSTRVLPSTVVVVLAVATPGIAVINSTPEAPCFNGMGQGNACNCAVEGAGLVEITGVGSEAVPFLATVNCADVKACAADLFTCLGLSFEPVEGVMTADGTTGEFWTAIGAGCADWEAPTEGLSLAGPFIEYDTRLWAGGATLPNTGSGGSQYDLTIEPDATYGQRARLNLGTGPFAWSDIGGNANTAGFCIVVAVAARSTGGPGARTYIEGTFIFNQSTIATRFANSIVQFDVTADYDFEAYKNPVFGPPDGLTLDLLTPGGASLADSVIIMAYDAATGDYGIWINGTPVTPDDAINMGPGNVLSSPAITDVFMFLGQDLTNTASGKWANGAYASAFYRGYPTAGDIAILQGIYG